jgi:hypothetical protein
MTIFRQFNQWLLTGLIVVTPYFGLKANLADELPESPAAELVAKHSTFQALDDLFSALLVNNTVYFHDWAAAVMGGFPVEFAIDNNNLLVQNANAIGQALHPNHPVLAQQAASLFVQFIAAGQAYTINLNTTENFFDPTVVAALQNWFATADQIAAHLTSINSSVFRPTRTQQLLRQYATLLSNMVNDLLETATMNPNFTESALFYTEARALAGGRLARLIARALIPDFD